MQTNQFRPLYLRLVTPFAGKALSLLPRRQTEEAERRSFPQRWRTIFRRAHDNLLMPKAIFLPISIP